jgi:hypothetical protein
MHFLLTSILPDLFSFFLTFLLVFFFFFSHMHRWALNPISGMSDVGLSLTSDFQQWIEGTEPLCRILEKSFDRYPIPRIRGITGQPEQNSQIKTGRRGQSEQDSKNRTARAEQSEAGARQQEQEI